MTHALREKSKLVNRVRRVRGLLDAIERALDEDKGCPEVLHLIAAARGGISGLMGEVLEDHIRERPCVSVSYRSHFLARSLGLPQIRIGELSCKTPY